MRYALVAAILISAAGVVSTQAIADEHDGAHYVRHEDWKKGAKMRDEDWRRGGHLDYKEHHLRKPPRGYEWRGGGWELCACGDCHWRHRIRCSCLDRWALIPARPVRAPAHRRCSVRPYFTQYVHGCLCGRIPRSAAPQGRRDGQAEGPDRREQAANESQGAGKPDSQPDQTSGDR